MHKLAEHIACCLGMLLQTFGYLSQANYAILHLSNSCILDNAWQLHNNLCLDHDVSEGLACLL